MTDITLEKRARELLAEVLSIPVCMVDDVQSVKAAYMLEAMTAAMRLSAGADWVLVPREPTEAMRTAHAMYGDTSDWWQAVIAAAPRHEPGEVDRG